MSELVHPRSGSIARASPPRMTPAAPSCCSGTNSWVCVLEPLWGRHCWGAGRVLPGTMSTGGEAACPTPTPHPWIIQRQRKDLFSGVIQGPPPKERVLLPGAVEGAPGAPQEPGGRWGGGGRGGPAGCCSTPTGPPCWMRTGCSAPAGPGQSASLCCRGPGSVSTPDAFPRSRNALPWCQPGTLPSRWGRGLSWRGSGRLVSLGPVPTGKACLEPCSCRWATAAKVPW